MTSRLDTQKKRIRKVSFLLLTILLPFIVLSAVFSAAFFGVLFGRIDGGGAAELTYADIDPARYPRTEVRFASGPNMLTGYLYDTPGRAEGLVLVIGGVGSNADRHLAEIMYFADHGLCALAFDATGVGQSEGAGTRGLPQIKLDALAAIAYIRSEPALASLPLVLYGHSAGGYAAMAVLEDAPDIAAAVSIAGFESPVKTMHYHARRYVGPLADIEYPFMALENYRLFGDDADISAVDAINASDVPVLVIEGACDTTVPADIGVIAQADRIENPNVLFMTVDAPYRGEHSTVWLSESAARYQLALADDPDVPPALPAADRLRANELDAAFMETLLTFYAAAIAQG